MVPVNKLPMRAIQIYEFIRGNGWNAFFKEVIYVNRKAIVYEKDLTEANFQEDLFRDANVEFIEVHPETLSERNLVYAQRNRYLKAMYYLGKGYKCHALVRGYEVIGDIWHFAPRESKGATGHVDPQWLGITLGLDSIYYFDTYFMPTERGNNLSAALQNSSMYVLHKKGYAKAYGYCWADNTPAVWNTRVVIKWKELKKIAASRFFLFRRAVEIN